MSFYQDFKSLYQTYILLFIILLFVIVYVVINWKIVRIGNYLGGEYTRPILITCIIFLIFHMLITWDENDVDSDNETIDLSKYKFKYGIDNIIKNDIIGTNQINHQIPTNIQTIPIIQTLPTNHITQNAHQEQIIPEKSNLINVQSLNNKYRVVNKFDNNINNNKLNNFINNHSNDSKLSNQNIFISHRNSSKYGLKF